MNYHPVALSKRELAGGFVVKALMGILYGWIFLHYYPHDDTLLIHAQSIDETSRLLHDPSAFFRDYLPLYILDPANGEKHRFTLFLVNIEYALLVKTLAFANLISRGNYYINVVLLNCIVFWGHYWLFNVLNKQFPDKRPLLYAAVFFFLPAVFWLSGIRSDGLLFFFFGLLLSQVTRECSVRSVLLGVAGFIGVLIMRVEFGLLALIALVAYSLSLLWKKRPALVFLSVYVCCSIIFFIQLPTGSNGLVRLIAGRQHQFLALRGTRFSLDPLQPSFSSYLHVFPQAIVNSSVKPFLWQAHGVLQWIYALEVLLVIGLVIAAVLLRTHDWKLRLFNPVILFLLWFSISGYIMIGYTVPFPGAIVRYKCIPELLLVCCSLIIIKWPGRLKRHSN